MTRSPPALSPKVQKSSGHLRTTREIERAGDCANRNVHRLVLWRRRRIEDTRLGVRGGRLVTSWFPKLRLATAGAKLCFAALAWFGESKRRFEEARGQTGVGRWANALDRGISAVYSWTNSSRQTTRQTENLRAGFEPWIPIPMNESPSTVNKLSIGRSVFLFARKTPRVDSWVAS